MEQTVLTRNELIAQLVKSTHRAYEEYVPITERAVRHEPEFLAHLIAWNALKGQIRDSKVAIPTITLMVPGYPKEFVENSLAHLGLQNPRMLMKSVRFFSKLRKHAIENGFAAGNNVRFEHFLKQYLSNLEKDRNKWRDQTVMYRKAMKELYMLTHRKNELADKILFKKQYDPGSVYAAIASLQKMAATDPAGAAQVVLEKRIPVLVALAAMGKQLQDPRVLGAMIERMSPTDIVTQMRMLEKWGVKKNPITRVALEKALGKVSESTKNTLKTTRYIDELEDEGLKERLRDVQEKQMKKISVNGNWLVLCDKSGSQAVAIEAGRHIAATLAKMVTGNVHLVFFDVSARYINVTGKDYDKLQAETKLITAQGGTSIGVGLDYAISRGFEFDGVSIISDAQENSPPFFHEVYQKYCKKVDRDIPVYLYRTASGARGFSDRDLKATLRGIGVDLQEFDITNKKVDFYSLPNLVQTMRVNKYSLIDEIMDTDLLSLSRVFKNLKEKVQYA